MSISAGIVILSSAILILSEAVKKFAGVSWEGIFKGLTGIGILLAELTLFTKYTGDSKNIISTGVAILLFGEAMRLFTMSIKSLGDMQWDGISKGLSNFWFSVIMLTIALNRMPKNMITIGLGLTTVGVAMDIMAKSNIVVWKNELGRNR